jgi:hypothetical protein
MRCKVCDYDIELSFISELPGEDYCKVCENIILVCALSVQNVLS